MDEPIRENVTPVRRKRRKKRALRYGAFLGFVVLVFAVVGVISTVVGMVGLIGRWTDDSALREELSRFLDPVMQSYPPEFSDAGSTDKQDALVLSAVYSIARTEQIRQLREKDTICRYTLAEDGRMTVPKKDVEAAFARLFGDKSIRAHKTLRAGVVDFDEEKQCYYVERTFTVSDFLPVIDSVKEKKGVYTVRVLYVHKDDVAYDAHGAAIAPTAKDGKFPQRYRVRRDEDGSLTLLSVESEPQPNDKKNVIK